MAGPNDVVAHTFLLYTIARDLKLFMMSHKLSCSEDITQHAGKRNSGHMVATGEVILT